MEIQISKMPTTTFQSILFSIALGLVFATGIFFRIWQLDSVPPGLHPQEAQIGLETIEASGAEQLFQIATQEGDLNKALIALSLQISAPNSFFLRLPGAILGILTVFGFFLLCRQLTFSRLSALLGTFAITFSFWHINFSRLAFTEIVWPFFTVWGFLFFFKGLQGWGILGKRDFGKKFGAKAYFFLSFSGMLLGIGILFDVSLFLLFVVVFFLVVFLSMANNAFLRTGWKALLLILFWIVLATLAIFVFGLHGSGKQMLPLENISIFKESVSDFFGILWRNTTASLSALFFYGDSNQAHNHNSFPLLPLVWSLLMALGFFLSAKEIASTLIGKFKKTKGSRLFVPAVFSQAVFWIMLLAGILIPEGTPNSRKMLGIIPATLLFICFALEFLLKLKADLEYSSRLRFKPLRWNVLRASLFGIFAAFVLSGFFQAYLYFGIWAKDPLTEEVFNKQLFALGKLANELPRKDKNYLIVPAEILGGSEDLKKSIRVALFSGWPKIESYTLLTSFEALSSVSCEESGEIQFVFYKTDDWLKDQFQKKCPDLVFEKIQTKKAPFEFWVLK